jgi:addiction module HigA family antidote
MSGNPLLKGLKPTHPGEFLREDVLPALGIPKTEIAKRLGISRAMLYAILEERSPVTPAMALRLGKLLGTTPESWLNMQRDYDLRLLEQEMSDELNEIDPVAA